MNLGGIRILLVSKGEGESSYLREQLERRGYSCSVAGSTEEVVPLLDQGAFDLILSTIWLRDHLIAKLADSASTVFFAYPVRNSCLWLPILDRGRDCLGAPALRPNQFAKLVAQIAQRSPREEALAA